MDGTKIQSVDSHKHLGLTLQSDGQWQLYTSIYEIMTKVSKMVDCLRSLNTNEYKQHTDLVLLLYVTNIRFL